MKLLLILLLIFLNSNLFAQSKEFVVAESETNIPIEFATVYYPNNFDGTISNKEGKFKISIKQDTLVVSHILYQTHKEVLINKDLPDTIYLKPAIINLECVTVYGINLKEKLEDVRSKLSEIYISESSLKECTYKESLRINRKLTRLLQIQLNWWSRNNHLSSKRIEKNNHFSLKRIDFSRNDSVYAAGYMDNKFIISHLYLDWYLDLLTHYSPVPIQILNIRSNDKNSIIEFETPIVVNNDTIYFLKKSSIVFNKDNGAIDAINLHCIYNNRIKHEITPQGDQFKHQIKEHYLKIKFNQYSMGKMGLSYFLSNILGEVKFGNQSKDEFIISQEFFITKIIEKGKIRRRERSDLDKPFYQNAPTLQHIENMIILDEEESNYINYQK